MTGRERIDGIRIRTTFVDKSFCDIHHNTHKSMCSDSYGQALPQVMARRGVKEAKAYKCRRRHILNIIVAVPPAIAAKILKTVTDFPLHFYHKTVFHSKNSGGYECSRKYQPSGAEIRIVVSVNTVCKDRGEAIVCGKTPARQNNTYYTNTQ